MTDTKALKVVVVGYVGLATARRLIESIEETRYIAEVIDYEPIPDFMLYHLVDTQSVEMRRILDTHANDKRTPPKSCKYNVTSTRCIVYANECWYNEFCNHL